MIYTNNKITFNGSLLKSRFGYDFYKEKYKPTGIVVIFDGPINIEYDELVFNQVYPVIEESINICWEIPNLNLLGNNFFKQLFLSKIKEYLNINDNIDDYFVSLTRETEPNLSLGFIGLNLSLLNINKLKKEEVCSMIDSIFYELTQTAFIDKIKTL